MYVVGGGGVGGGANSAGFVDIVAVVDVVGDVRSGCAVEWAGVEYFLAFVMSRCCVADPVPAGGSRYQCYFHT